MGSGSGPTLWNRDGTYKGLYPANTGDGLYMAGNTGLTPTSGAGNRLMYIPSKYAFRCGKVTGAQWDDANIGLGSVAFGVDNKVDEGGFACGQKNVVGIYASAFGYNCVSVPYSAVFGNNCHTINGGVGLAVGYYVTAGFYSTAIGVNFNNDNIHFIATGVPYGSFALGVAETGKYHRADGMGAMVLGTNDTALDTYDIVIGKNIRIGDGMGSEESSIFIGADYDSTGSDYYILSLGMHREMVRMDGGLNTLELGHTTPITIGKTEDMTGGSGNWFRPPQMTTTERNTMTGSWGPSDKGKLWFNTTINKIEYWNGALIVSVP